MGFKFSLILDRTITKKETTTLRDNGCGQAVFGTDKLPTDASVTVARLDFDDTESDSLAAAIEAGMEAVKKVPGLKVPGLNVPAQPAHRPSADEAEAEGSDLVEAAARE